MVAYAISPSLCLSLVDITFESHIKTFLFLSRFTAVWPVFILTVCTLSLTFSNFIVLGVFPEMGGTSSHHSPAPPLSSVCQALRVGSVCEDKPWWKGHDDDWWWLGQPETQEHPWKTTCATLFNMCKPPCYFCPPLLWISIFHIWQLCYSALSQLWLQPVPMGMFQCPDNVKHHKELTLD